MQDDDLPERPRGPDSAPSRGALADALEKIAAGDWASFETVHRLTASKLLQICRSILPDPGDAEDALQETYATVWRRAEAFDRSRGTAMTWLITIARNHSLDRLRASARSITTSIESAGDIPDDRASALEALVQAEVEQRLAASLDRLDERNRWLVHAVFFDGVTYANLAAQVGVPLETVKSRVRRALLKARSTIAPDEDELEDER